MKKIPEELKKQGVRWVFDVDRMPRLLAIESLHVFVVVLKGREEDFLNGRHVYFENIALFQEIPQPQEPKKIPYTAETFPENAIWVRRIGKKERMKFELWENKHGCTVICLENGDITSFFSEDGMIDNYEIGCQVIKDEEIKIEWKPFFEIK